MQHSNELYIPPPSQRMRSEHLSIATPERRDLPALYDFLYEQGHYTALRLPKSHDFEHYSMIFDIGLLHGLFVVRALEDNAFLGVAGYHSIETLPGWTGILCAFPPEKRGHGHFQEAVLRLGAFALKWSECTGIAAQIPEGNPAFERLLRSVGMNPIPDTAFPGYQTFGATRAEALGWLVEHHFPL